MNSIKYLNDLSEAAVRHHKHPSQTNLDALIHAAAVYAESKDPRRLDVARISDDDFLSNPSLIRKCAS